MIPVFQTIVDPAEGNCFPACLASILELELEFVPHFLKLYGRLQMMTEARKWLNHKFGLTITTVDVTGPKKAMIIRPLDVPTIIMVSGNSHSFPGNPHVVVGITINDINDYELLHDPNPSGKGLNSDPYWYYFFSAVDPAKVIRRFKGVL